MSPGGGFDEIRMPSRALVTVSGSAARRRSGYAGRPGPAAGARKPGTSSMQAERSQPRARPSSAAASVTAAPRRRRRGRRGRRRAAAGPLRPGAAPAHSAQTRRRRLRTMHRGGQRLGGLHGVVQAAIHVQPAAGLHQMGGIAGQQDPPGDVGGGDLASHRPHRAREQRQRGGAGRQEAGQPGLQRGVVQHRRVALVIAQWHGDLPKVGHAQQAAPAAGRMDPGGRRPAAMRRDRRGWRPAAAARRPSCRRIRCPGRPARRCPSRRRPAGRRRARPFHPGRTARAPKPGRVLIDPHQFGVERQAHMRIGGEPAASTAASDPWSRCRRNGNLASPASRSRSKRASGGGRAGAQIGDAADLQPGSSRPPRMPSCSKTSSVGGSQAEARSTRPSCMRFSSTTTGTPSWARRRAAARPTGPAPAIRTRALSDTNRFGGGSCGGVALPGARCQSADRAIE